MSSWLHGYVDRTGRFVVPPSLRLAERFEDGFASAAPFGERRFGLLAPDGHWLVEPTFDFLGERAHGTVPVNTGGQWGQYGVEGGRWGLVDRQGMRIPPRFEYLGALGAGLLPFRQGEVWGYVDAGGKVVVPARFEWAGSFTGEGVAVATEGGRDGYLKSDGTWLLEPAWSSAAEYTAGRGRVQIDGAWVLVDETGQPLSDPFDAIGPFMAGMARVERGGAFAFIGLDGTVLGDAWFHESAPYAGGLAPVRRDEEWFFLDAKGQVHGPYERAMSLTEGLARFVDARGVGFLAADGTVAIEPRFESALGFASGFAGVKREGRWTFIDPKGREITPPAFDGVQSFSADGLAPVRAGNRFGAIDTTGAFAFEPAFDSLDVFGEGLARAQRVRFPRTLHKAPAAWHVLPRQCLAFRGFDGAGPEDQIRVMIGFSPPLDPDQLLRASQIYGCWRDLYAARVDGGEFLVGEPWLVDYALAVRVGGLSEPARALDRLVHELARLDLPVQEVVFGRFRDDPAQPPEWSLLYHVMPAWPHPDDPRGPWQFPDWDTYWAQVWDPDAVPPASEALLYLRAGRWNPRSESLVFDERIFSLYLPGVRICYGVFQSGFTDVEDARSKAVATAIEAALAHRFDRERIWVFPGNADWAPPVPLSREWDRGVDVIECDDRRGYYFAIECPSLLQDAGPDAFRYREPELMEALAGVIADLDLAPVILWQRFGDPLQVPSVAGAAHPMNPTFCLVELWEPSAG